MKGDGQAVALLVAAVLAILAMQFIGAAIDNTDPNRGMEGHCPAPQHGVEYERCK